MSAPKLSKSRYLAGLQCPKRLVMECYHHDKRDPLDEMSKAIMAEGTRVGELAREAFPGGVLVEEGYLEHEAAVGTTLKLIADESPVLYEAALLAHDVRIRIDILRGGSRGGFELIEVKSSTRVKDEHVDDLAVQLYVATLAGIEVKACTLMHVDNQYLYEGGGYELGQLFARRDLTERVRLKQDEVKEKVGAFHALVADGTLPEVEVGPHCKSPHVCPFFSTCHADLLEHRVEDLPGITREKVARLKQDGLGLIEEIPDGYPGLNRVQQRARAAVVTQQPYFGPELGRELQALRFPLYFIDFETFGAALPVYAGIRPYQQIAIQWSCHVMDESGNLRHCEFLADGERNPEREFIETLLKACGDRGSVVVYTSFERKRLAQLQLAFPDLAAAIQALIARLWDLYVCIKNYTYHPDYKGSFSIKSVLPALVPGLGYADLTIADGGSASHAFRKIWDLPAEEKDEVREALLRYCERDTLAMVEIYRVLKKIC